MTLLADMIVSGWVTLIILALLVAEALAYVFLIKRLRAMLPTLAAGASLVLALRAALLQHSPHELALFLALAFIFHILEIRQWLKMSKHQPH